jgi:hypothetical protein
MTTKENQEIKSWLDSDRNYPEGVRLFSLCSRNVVLKRIFPNKEVRYANKLAYELGKLIVQQPGAETKRIPNLKPSPLKPSPTPEKQESPDSIFLSTGDFSQPKVIRRIMAEFSELYKLRSMTHNQMKRVPPDNRPENVAVRRDLVTQMARHSNRMDELFAAHKNWTETRILPDENILFLLIVNPEPDLKEDPVQELIRIRLNLMKSMNSDLNHLNYQNTRKQPVGNPMPAGPKRLQLEKRISEKQAKIDELKVKIHGLNKVQ